MVSRSIGAWVLLCTAQVCAVAAAQAAQPSVGPRAAYVEGEVLVGYHRQTSIDQRQRVRASVGAIHAERVSARTRLAERLTLPAGRSVEKAIERLKRDPRVRFAEPNYRVKSAATPNDPLYLDGRLWGMLGDATVPGNAFGSGAAEAWAAGYIGSSDVYIGILDEGVQITHPDLVDNIWVHPHEVPNDGIDNDGNGYVDDVNGWDFFSNDATVYDDPDKDAHGTHVAGTIGARGGNGIGVAGVNWRAGIIPAKFLGPDGGSVFDAIRAIDYLIDLKTRHGLNLVAINNSWAGGDFSHALLEAIQRAGDADILFVAAAGNEAADNDTSSLYPANYNCSTPTRSADCVIAVASITSNGALSGFSRYGATTVDLAPRSTSFGHSGLARSTTYYYRVSAGNAAGTSAPSNTLTATTLMSDPPAAPSNVAARLSSNRRSVSVTWQDRSNNETGFEVARQQLINGTWSAAAVIATLGPNTRSFVDTPGAAGTYRYLVRSVSGSSSAGWAGPSSSVVTR
jgi:hypothetical protein